MENEERDLSRFEYVYFRVSFMDKKCLGNINQIFYSLLWKYIMKTARSTMMSPRDKMHVIELLVAKEHLYIHLKGIFQCIIMLCNQNERQRQSKQMFCVCVTMICRKWSPRDNILSMIILQNIYLCSTICLWVIHMCCMTGFLSYKSKSSML